MKYKLLLLICVLLLSAANLLFGQVEYDSTKCINLYTNDSADVYTLVARDTCMVSLALGYPQDVPVNFNWDSLSKQTYTIPASISKVKNLFELSVQTQANLKIENTVYNYQFLSSIFIRASINKNSFPMTFYNSSMLEFFMLVYCNEVKELPSAVIKRKAGKEFCRLIIAGRSRYSNNSKKFFNNLLKVVASKNYNTIKIQNAKFTQK